jgi:3,4-dihydroxy 2-butanone 4-phosphate synthase / GTP cyclohydrolase II
MLSPIPEILDDLRAGKMVILVDDEDRENEGDLVLPAQFISAESVAFMLTVARGYMCLSLTEQDCDRLDLHPQAAVNTSVRGTPMTVSIDGHPRHGFTTGVSAAERARCIQMAIDPSTGPSDFVRPGHINPLRSRDGGVLVRTGQTEGSLDLCRLAGLTPAAVIIEVMRDDGEMARLPDLERLAEEHELKICSVAQIIEHRLAEQPLVRRLAPLEGTPVTTPEGEFRLFRFESVVDRLPHLALACGEVGRPGGDSDEPALVRVHRRDLLGDVFGVGASGGALRASLRAIREAGRGAVVYLRPDVDPGLGGELVNPAAVDDDPDAPKIPTPMREYGVGGQILRDLGLHKLRLMTTAPKSLPALDAFGLEIVEQIRIPCESAPGEARRG